MTNFDNMFDKLQGVDFKSDNNFLELKPKTQPSKPFLVPNLFFYFSTKLFNSFTSRVLISKMTIVFKIVANRYSHKALWSQIYEFLFLRKTLRFNKFVSTDFKITA